MVGRIMIFKTMLEADKNALIGILHDHATEQRLSALIGEDDGMVVFQTIHSMRDLMDKYRHSGAYHRMMSAITPLLIGDPAVKHFNVVHKVFPLPAARFNPWPCASDVD